MKKKFKPLDVQYTLAIHMAVHKQLPKAAAEEVMSAVWNATVCGERGPGRPKKKKGQEVDSRRASIVDFIANEYPQSGDTTEDLIDAARLLDSLPELIRSGRFSLAEMSEEDRSMFNEIAKETHGLDGLFPEHQDLRSSISRGRAKLRAVRSDDNSPGCEKG
ncbi:MAG: hypothetical protein AAF683_04125 [Pseudomonadota bacterium]